MYHLFTHADKMIWYLNSNYGIHAWTLNYINWFTDLLKYGYVCFHKENKLSIVISALNHDKCIGICKTGKY